MADLPPQTARDLERFRRRLKTVSQFAPGAVNTAINKGLVTMRKQAAGDIAPMLAVPIKQIKRRLWMRRSKKSKLRASLRASTLRLGARGRATKSGVTVGAKAALRNIPQAWLDRKGYVLQRLGGVPIDPAGHVFKGKGRTRYPIQAVTTPSPAELWTTDVPAIMRAGTESMRKVLDHELARLGSR